MTVKRYHSTTRSRLFPFPVLAQRSWKHELSHIHCCPDSPTWYRDPSQTCAVLWWETQVQEITIWGGICCVVQVHDAIAWKGHPRIASCLAWKTEGVVNCSMLLKLWEPLWHDWKGATERVGICGCSRMQESRARPFGSCSVWGRVLKRCGREGRLVLDWQFLLNQVC